MDGNLPFWPALLQSPAGVRPIVTEITTVFNRLYPVRHPTRVDPRAPEAQVTARAFLAEQPRSLARCCRYGSVPAGRGRPASTGGGTRIQTMTAPAASAAAGLRQRAGLPVLTWPAFDPLPVEAMVTTRHGGGSAGRYATLNLSFAVGDEPANVRENRRRVAAALGAPLDAFVFAAPGHRHPVAGVSAGDPGRGALAADHAIRPAH